MTLQDVAGYALSGAASLRLLLWLYGEAGTGEGTYSEILMTILGDLSETVSPKYLANDGDRERLGALIWGKRVAACAEAGNARLDAESLKTLSGGNRLSVRKLFSAWFDRYSWRIEEKHLPHAPSARTTYLLQVGQDGFTLLDAIRAYDTDPSLNILWERRAVQILRRVWEHHFERQAEACRWKEPGEWLPTGECVHSPYDPEAHFSDKRGVKWLGYKVHYTETCDQDGVHLIVDSETCFAEIPDVASTHAIQQKLAKKELCPQEHLVDAGYTDAELLVTSQQQQITLIGPMRVNSSWQAKAGQGYDLPHFSIDWDRQRATCPEGKSSTKWRPGKDAFGNEIIQLQFSRSDCSSCAARSLCTRAKSSPRHIVLHPREQHEALLWARQEEQSATWLARYHVRAGIEGTLSQGIRAFGLRRTRYVGLAKTALQHATVAAAINVVRVTAWLADTPRITTRTSRFASLCLTA
ncbi:hypothetical protein FNU79_09790 [Deinococcus detaillensis]|uniref:Transposase DDE domain-containing protein n=1 Tax=Deinococcus detaillensis TaxID=2592048 RepID=A0A553UZ49_9DEIO|nr:transposase [Deinococcus detaillensis]TSA85478.1 hypothetical protein FNU79_09790 [Deinococcus detaillensis]